MCNFLDSSVFAFDVIGLSETWFTSHTDVNSFQIPGYTLIIDNRTYSIGGAVALFVKSDFSFCIRNDLKIDLIKNIWIETQDMIIGVIYKPPNFSNTEFLDKLDVTLHSIFLSRKKCLIMGDTNINTLRKTSASKDYINMVQSEGFNPVIFEATRVTESSQSCIDHIFINFAESSTSGSVAIEIADHLPVFSILYDPELSPFPDSIEFKDFKGFNRKRFKCDLEMENWSSVFDGNDVNESYSRFLHIFNKVSNNHAPLKLVKLKNKSFKPWVTTGLKKSMKTRDKIYKKWLASHDLVFLNKYKFYRNKITVINKIYRESFYNQVLSNSSDGKKMWDNINIIINKKRPNSHIEKLHADDKYYQ